MINFSFLFLEIPKTSWAHGRRQYQHDVSPFRESHIHFVRDSPVKNRSVSPSNSERAEMYHPKAGRIRICGIDR